MSESCDVTWRHIEFRPCVWPVDMVSALIEIFMNRMLAREVKFLALERHTNIPDVMVPLPRVVKLFASHSRK